jgi:hypothetical protein
VCTAEGDRAASGPEALAKVVPQAMEKSEAARRRAQAGRDHVLEHRSAERLFPDVRATSG